jgi:hypothetical protein
VVKDPGVRVEAEIADAEVEVRLGRAGVADLRTGGIPISSAVSTVFRSASSTAGASRAPGSPMLSE